MIEKEKINRAMITASFKRYILLLSISIILTIFPLIWILSGSRSGLGYLYGLTLAAIYYCLYLACTLLMRNKNIALGAAFMLITYLMRLSVVAAGLYLALFVFELAPLFTVISFMLTHGIIMMFSGGMPEKINFKKVGLWKEQQQSA